MTRPTLLTREDIERQIREMWDALSDHNGDPEYAQACEQARAAERQLWERFAQQERLRDAAPALAEALLDMHRYGQTDLGYLRSPSCAKTHQAVVDAGVLTETGFVTHTERACQRIDAP
jgi:hypothetical protein